MDKVQGGPLVLSRKGLRLSLVIITPTMTLVLTQIDPNLGHDY